MKIFTILRNIVNGIKTSFARLTSLESWQGDVADYIVEQVVNENNGYTKWASGKLECWGRMSKTASATTKWNNIYYGTTSGFTYAHSFIDLPTVLITIQSSAGNLWMTQEHNSQTTTGTTTIYVFCSGTISNQWCTFNMYAVGTWK